MTTSTVPASVLDLLAERRPGHSLPGPLYTSPEIFDLDVAAVFARTWIFVAAEAELRRPGSYVTVDIGPQSVIITRDRENTLHAMHNVCRHRGSRLIETRCGSAGHLVCPYHRWSYRLDGRLHHAEGQADDFDTTGYRLKPVHVRTVGGLIFICMADVPPADFDEVGGRIRPYLVPHELQHTKVAAQDDVVEPGNWKLVMENNRECYHCVGHPELSCSLFPTYGYAADEVPHRLQRAYQRYQQADADLRATCERHDLPYSEIEELDTRPTGFRIQREPLDLAGESFADDGRVLSRRLLGRLTEPRLGRLSLHTQPNAWFHLLSDHAITFTVLPIAADATLLRTTWLVHEDAVEGIDYDLERLTRVWRATNDQDSAFVARAHRGVSSPAYAPGPYAPNEYQVDAFCNWYLDRLRAHLR